MLSYLHYILSMYETLVSWKKHLKLEVENSTCIIRISTYNFYESPTICMYLDDNCILKSFYFISAIHDRYSSMYSFG